MKQNLFNAYLILLSRKTIILIICLIIGNHSLSFSQDSRKIDSLETLLSTSEALKRVGLLDKLSKQYIKSNSAKSLEYAKEMLALSEKLQDDFQLQKSFLNCARSYYNLSELDSVLFYADRIVQLQKQTENYSVTGTGYMLICNVNIIRGNYGIALDFGEKALDTYKKISDTLEMATTLKNLSYIFKARGEYEKALEYALNAVKIFELSNDTLRIASGLGTIANIYTSTGNLKLAKEYFIRTRNILKYQKKTLIYAQVLGGLAGIYRQEGQNDSSLYLYQQGLTITESLKNPLLEGKMNMNMANTLKADNKFNEALTKFMKAKRIFTSINSEKDINHVNYSLGETYLESKQYDSAEIYLSKSLNTSKKKNSALLFEASLKQLYLLYEETSNYKNAFQFHKLYVQYHDSIIGQDVQVKIAELETKYKTAKKDQQITELELQKEIEKSEKIKQRIVFSSIVFLFLVLLFGIWQKRNKDKQIHYQKELFHKKEKQLAKVELEKSKLKEEELNQSILYKSKQLSTHALHMMQKNTMLQDIKLDINTMAKKAPVDDKPNYKRISQQINQSLRSDKDWDVFKLYFEDVNRNFYQKLNEINPELTTNDHRLCALIKLNMTSKEMASVLNVAPNSIKSSRYRLKKKLGLDVEADLEEFIRNIG
ncbi:MAG: tetratricopeptide repeat protein [Bacteroidetes bacterium]|nr:tetratricopeptide repeat protein [Bacteroidota bacterium]